MNKLTDTIVASITGTTMAPVTVVRLSGPDSWFIAEKLFDPWPTRPQSHHAVYGRFAHGDSGLALPFAMGRGFTGEEAVEFSIHGSLASVRSLLDACKAQGARIAQPGEFSQRAFLNGRMDLSEAEAINDLIRSQTETQMRSALLQEGGFLKVRVERWRDQIRHLIGLIEAHTDFSEEIGEVDTAAVSRELEDLREALDEVSIIAKSSQILRRGIRVAIAGKPNAGKSSLLNLLLDSNRAIVSSTPGTTRDYIEELVEVRGLPCVFVDTAGLRDASDEIEFEGIRRSRDAILSADLVIYLFDAVAGFDDRDRIEVSTIPCPYLLVANKSDLADDNTGLRLSTVTRDGVTSLYDWIEAKGPSASLPMITARQAIALEGASKAVAACNEGIRHHLPLDIASVALREADRALAEVTGEDVSADLLETIFSDFCIGK